MEEKERYKYYTETNQIYDSEEDELYAYNLNNNKIISILNQQDKRIKELEQDKTKLMDWLNSMTENWWISYEKNKKLRQENKQLKKQLEEKEKYTYTGKEVGEIERKYDEKIDTLEQKLKSQPAEIVEKIKEQIFNHFNVKNIEEYERLSLLNALFTADAVAEILDTILTEYQK